MTRFCQCLEGLIQNFFKSVIELPRKELTKSTSIMILQDFLPKFPPTSANNHNPQNIERPLSARRKNKLNKDGEGKDITGKEDKVEEIDKVNGQKEVLEQENGSSKQEINHKGKQTKKSNDEKIEDGQYEESEEESDQKSENESHSESEEEKGKKKKQYNTIRNNFNQQSDESETSEGEEDNKQSKNKKEKTKANGFKKSELETQNGLKNNMKTPTKGKRNRKPLKESSDDISDYEHRKNPKEEDEEEIKEEEDEEEICEVKIDEVKEQMEVVDNSKPETETLFVEQEESRDIPSPPSPPLEVIVDMDKVHSLLKTVVTLTLDATVEEMILLRSKIYQRLFYHRENPNKEDLLEELDQIVNSR